MMVGPQTSTQTVPRKAVNRSKTPVARRVTRSQSQSSTTTVRPYSASCKKIQTERKAFSNEVESAKKYKSAASVPEATQKGSNLLGTSSVKKRNAVPMRINVKAVRPRKKFDLQASLARPVTWKLKKGKQFLNTSTIVLWNIMTLCSNSPQHVCTRISPINLILCYQVPLKQTNSTELHHMREQVRGSRESRRERKKTFIICTYYFFC